uniref:(northern house mosquito) hypothetical protein n=1 Tax=Culex pipiens TaxID=7175 RepID=A0A8D8G6V8_CULPI
MMTAGRVDWTRDHRLVSSSGVRGKFWCAEASQPPPVEESEFSPWYGRCCVSYCRCCWSVAGRTVLWTTVDVCGADTVMCCCTVLVRLFCCCCVPGLPLEPMSSPVISYTSIGTLLLLILPQQSDFFSVVNPRLLGPPVAS